MTESQIRPSAGLDRAFAEDFTRRWVAAFNSHDTAQLLALLTNDVVYDNPAWPTTIRSHADMGAFLACTWRAAPDMRVEVIDGPFLLPDRPDGAAPALPVTHLHRGAQNNVPPGFEVWLDDSPWTAE